MTSSLGVLSDDLLAERVELTRVVDADVKLARIVVELELEVGRRSGGDGRGRRGGAGGSGGAGGGGGVAGSSGCRFGVGDVAWVDSVYVGVVLACRGRSTNNVWKFHRR